MSHLPVTSPDGPREALLPIAAPPRLLSLHRVAAALWTLAHESEGVGGLGRRFHVFAETRRVWQPEGLGALGLDACREARAALTTMKTAEGLV